MPVRIIKEDLTKVQADALVNATDSRYSGSGGLDLAIHTASGPQMEAYLASLPPLSAGECAVSPAFGLKADIVIHTVAPVWHGGQAGEEQLLHTCYRSAFEKAREHGCVSVAVPLLGAGCFGCPEDTVYRIACTESRYFSDEYDMDISILIYRGAAQSIAGRERRMLDGLLTRGRTKNRSNAPYVEDTDTEADFSLVSAPEEYRECASPRPAPAKMRASAPQTDKVAYAPEEKPGMGFGGSFDDLEQELEKELKKKRADGFSETLMAMIDRSGMTDPECYHRANIDRKLFSKIRSDPGYRPAKKTVLAFAVALRLDTEETEILLRSAGYALNGSKMDTVVLFYISHGCYDIDRINITLYSYDQEILGARMA